MASTLQTAPEDPVPAAGASSSSDAATREFTTHRNLLFTVAYEMLGSAADAEDAVQETWLRWVRVDLDVVRDRRAYLIKITTRQALDRLRTLARRKESYVGPWLPEPLLTAPDVAEDVEFADSVSMAMLILQSLLDVLAPDVVLLADGGGIRRAAQVPVVGSDDVAGFLRRVQVASLEPAQINGHPALVARRDGEIETVVVVHVGGGLVTGLSIVRNPEKLSHLDRGTLLYR